MAPSTSPGQRARVRAATPTDVSAAIAARRARERRRHLLVLGVMGAVAAVLAGLVWLVGYSSVLASKQVVVNGTSLLKPEQVEEVAEVPMGVPLSRLSTAPVAERVSTLPQVDEVSVRTRWPGSVVIDVRERTPVFQMRQGPGWLLVDLDGVGYTQVAKQDKGLPLVTSDEHDTAALSDVARVVQSLTPPLRAQLVQVTSGGTDQIVLQLKGGRRIVWGGAEQSETKAQVAQALLGQDEFNEFNVSSPGNPTAR